MDEYMIVLRIIHIFAGAYWFGAGVFAVGILEPAVETSGKAGKRFMQHLSQRKAFATSFPIVAVLTVVSGVLLYNRVSGGFDSDWITSKPGIALTFGGIVGIAELIFGGAVHGPTTAKLADLGKQIEASGAPPAPEQSAELERLLQLTKQMGYISVGLLTIALFCMAIARYLYG